MYIICVESWVSKLRPVISVLGRPREKDLNFEGGVELCSRLRLVQGYMGETLTQ